MKTSIGTRSTHSNTSLYIKALQGRAKVYEIIGNWDLGLIDLDTAAQQTHDTQCIAEINLQAAQILMQGKSDYIGSLGILTKAFKTIKKENPVFKSQFLVAFGNIHRLLGNYSRAHAYLVRAQSIYRNTNDTIGQMQINQSFGVIYQDRGMTNEALVYFRRALAITSSRKNYDRHTGLLYNNIGLIHQQNSDYKKALLSYKHALGYASKVGDKRLTQTILGNIGIVNAETGNYQKALAYFYKYLESSKEMGFQRGIALASGNICLIYYFQGDVKKSLKYALDYLNISRQINYKWGVSVAALNLGNIYRTMGDLRKARSFLALSLDVSQKAGDKNTMGCALNILNDVYIDQKKYNLATKNLRVTQKLFAEMGDRLRGIETLICLARLDACRGYYKRAIIRIKETLGMLKIIESKENEITALRAMGNALLNVTMQNYKNIRLRSDNMRLNKCLCRARKYIERSLTLAQKQHMALEKAKSEFELARFYWAIGEQLRARSLFIHTEMVFKKAGAKLFLKNEQNYWKQLTNCRIIGSCFMPF